MTQRRAGTSFHLFFTMNPQEYYRRIQAVVRPEQLHGRKVMVIGLGSGGSRLAAELGRLGLDLCLVDRPNERLEEHNVIRHLLDYRSLGELKTQAVAEWIRHRNPWTRVQTLDLDVVAQSEQLAAALEERHPDLIAVCTDNLESQFAVNILAVQRGIPEVGAAVYDGGVGGEVYCVRPAQACLGCIAAHLQLQRPEPRTDLNIDYNQLDRDELRSVGALNLDIEQIAILQTRMALQLLLGTATDLTGIPPDVNLLVFANRTGNPPLNRPLHAEFFRIPANPDCLICGAPMRTGNAGSGSVAES
ncbi:MAG TPA: ThiF family adenylyltransferase [Candidatus Paceibacterota bacterium]|nr:ThiF family adenylyltransferase [Verrucomicrobiota bacterium]HRZ44995.1 ThiF family adenylyltransferase [Candidatus Paceibacterota bacterium]HRZ99353.1 ThiF family adenylyltransferase [Candidatus Paceibacterota bacterium]